MYPVVRMAKEFWVNRNASPIKFGEFHVSHHVCWPWDLDMWGLSPFSFTCVNSTPTAVLRNVRPGLEAARDVFAQDFDDDPEEDAEENAAHADDS